MVIDRRALLTYGALLPFAGLVPRLARAAADGAAEQADYTLRIKTGLVELSPEHLVSTTLYNGQFPGPLLRFTEGQRAVVDVQNAHRRSTWPSTPRRRRKPGSPFRGCRSSRTGADRI